VTEEQAKINEAFENFLDSYLPPAAMEKIRACYGEEVATTVKAIYDDAMNAPVDWRTASMDSALALMHEHLSSKYPWLSPLARRKLNYAFIMAWK
jgi:hypothetical protein